MEIYKEGRAWIVFCCVVFLAQALPVCRPGIYAFQGPQEKGDSTIIPGVVKAKNGKFSIPVGADQKSVFSMQLFVYADGSFAEIHYSEKPAPPEKFDSGQFTNRYLETTHNCRIERDPSGRFYVHDLAYERKFYFARDDHEGARRMYEIVLEIRRKAGSMKRAAALVERAGRVAIR